MTAGGERAGSLLTVNELDVRFQGSSRGASQVRALDGVSLEWRRNEILGVVGESGSGKSTLARAILGLCPLAAGSVALEDAVVSGRRELRRLRRRVQVVFQDPYEALNPRESIRAIVSEPLQLHGVPRAEHDARVRRALSDVGLPVRVLERLPHELSGGQRQRVAIAAALVVEPKGLICDEPVSMLDVSVRSQILHLLLELRRERGLALLFITHDLSLAWSLCDRVAVMYLGRVVELGDAVEVIERPQHPYTQALVSVVPSTHVDDGRSRAILPGEPPDPSHLPSGCRFHPRCPRRIGICEREDPALRSVGEAEHRAACVLVGGSEAPRLAP